MQCEESLNWAMHVPSLGLAQRCLHVARAQAPALSPAVVDTLLSALLQCMLYPSGASFDFATEVLVALRELLDAADPQQVRLVALGAESWIMRGVQRSCTGPVGLERWCVACAGAKC